MNEDQIRDLIIVSIFLLIIIIPLVYLFIYILKGYRSSAIKKIQKFINDNNIQSSNLRLYSTGHPYTWCEISNDELITKIKENSVSSLSGVGPTPKPVKFLLNYNKNRHALHIVFTDKITFDWNSLLHYDEWLESKESLAENISKYKNS